MQQVAVHRIWLSRRGLNRNAVRFRIGDHFRPAGELAAELFEPPRRNHLDAWRQGRCVQFEAHLVISFAGRAVGNSRCSFSDGDVHHTLRNQRTGNACAKQVLTLIQSARLEHRVDEVTREFIAKIIDVDLRRAGCEGFFLQAIQFFLLADIGCKSNNLRIIGFFQPFQNNRGIQPAGVGEHNFFFWHGGATSFRVGGYKIR
ncbi:hypothetical protein D3C74_349700 [compost metagenome]